MSYIDPSIRFLDFSVMEGNGEVDSGGGAEAIAASEAYEKIALALNQGIAPERHLLHLLIKKSQDSVDLNRALDAMYNIRIEVCWEYLANSSR